MALVQRQLSVTFVLKQGTFALPTGASNSVTLDNLRASARVHVGGEQGRSHLFLQIWGMTLSTMNRLSTMGQRVQQDNNFNTVIVKAGDVAGGFTKTFEGNIVNCYGDFSSPPQINLMCEAWATHSDMLVPTNPVSYSSPTSAATAMQSVCSRMNGGSGIPFINNGVNATLDRPYLWGTPGQQLLQLIDAAGCSWNGGEDGTVTVWPRNGDNGKGSVVVSNATGMVSTPTFTQSGLIVKTLYNPAIKMGTPLEVISEVVTVPGGKWNTYAGIHALDAQIPRGEWFSTLWALNPKLSVTPPGPQP